VISFDFLIPPIATGGRQAADWPPTLSRHRHREAAWYSTANLASRLRNGPTSLLECAIYISARKKLIHAMSLHTDRSITRATVVGCAISAARNYLKLQMPRTLKSTVVQHSCRNAEVVEAFFRVAASRSNTCQSRLPSRAAPVLNPLSARCLAGAQLPRLRALALFGRRPVQRAERFVVPASKNQHKKRHQPEWGILRMICRTTPIRGVPICSRAGHRIWLGRRYHRLDHGHSPAADSRAGLGPGN
jgi:hypothetical protein